MALTHALGLRNDMADLVDAAVNVSAPGDLLLKVAGATASTIELNNPAFAAASGGDIVLDVVPEPTDSSAVGNAGAVDNFDFVDGTSTVVFSGVVGGGDPDITLTKAIIAAGDIVKITQFTYTATQ